ncbi:MAG TPA: phosphotransferase family protein [Myxococcales bacterium]|nr:phosphotransferase family protein [Myxococcales bacterium]HIK84317.1 phosphotransferase family protein [Myxococcales bacterium]
MGEQDIGDLEKIRVGVEAWLKKALPDRRDLHIAELAFPQASGESSVTLILEVTSTHGARTPAARGVSATDPTQEKFVFRMAPLSSQVFEKHDLLMQFQMMTLMADEGLPAPALIGYEPDPSIVGSDFYVMGFCEGRIPPDNPPFHAAGWLKDDVSAAERETMWHRGLEVVAAIHRIDLEKIDPNRIDLGRLPRAAKHENLLAQEFRTFDSMFKPQRRANADPRILEAWQRLERTMPEDGTPSLCWGDSRVGNVIFRDSSPVAILDWEMANISDPRTDLAWWIWIDRCNSEGLSLERLPGLPEPGDVYREWEALTGRSVAGIEWFELFAVVRYAIILDLKFEAFKAANSELGDIPNFVVPFIPGLMDSIAS